MAKVTCPVCGKKDQIQKISAVRNSGISTGSVSGPSGGMGYSSGKWAYAGGYSHMSVSTVTKLAQLLEFPGKISFKPEISGCAAAIAISVLGGVIILASLSSDNISLISGIGIGVFFVASLAYARIEKSNKDKQMAFDAKHETNNNKLYAKWERSYYCFRDNVVFDPVTGGNCPPDNLKDWLDAK